jgi:hypothetical protein
MSRAVVLPVDCVILHYTVDLFGIVGVVTNAAAWAGDCCGEHLSSGTRQVLHPFPSSRDHSGAWGSEIIIV